MSSQTVRISQSDHQALVELANLLGKSMSATLADAIQAYRKQKLLEETNTAYAELLAHPEEWAEVKAERELWDKTIADGLEGL